MNLIIESLGMVTLNSGFLINMSLIMVFGMVAGVKMNDGIRGFSRSMAILLPYIFIIVTTTLLRLSGAGFGTIGANAYNGINTILVTTLFYTAGLYIGHVIYSKAEKEVHQDYDDDTDV